MECRTTPAVFTVERVSGPLGEHGQSAAQVVGGGLQVNPVYEQQGVEEHGLGWVETATETEAIKQVVVGSAVVDLSPVGKPTTTYQFNPANVGSGPPAPFRIVADPANVPGAQVTTWIIQLEDMAAHTGCDWDYNDHSWTVRVTNYSLPLPTGPGAISGTVWMDNTRDNQLNFANDAPKANTLVTLTTATGGRWAETWTDANGFYAFTSLPLGNYRVRVNSWGIEKFVTQGYGGNAASDSDVDASGNSNLIPVSGAGSAQFPSADVDAGLFRSDPPSTGPWAQAISINKVDGVSPNLKVAKWSGGQDDWSRAFVRNAAGNAAQVRGVDVAGLDFIDHDPDRFNVMVKDTTLGVETTTVNVKISTTNANKPNYDDDETVIRLVRVTDQQNDPWWGWFWSDSQILVSNSSDDGDSRLVSAVPGSVNKNGGGMGADNLPPGNQLNQKLGYDFPVGDRTHLVALGSTVKAEYKPGNTPFTALMQVEIRKTVNLTIYLMQQPGLNGGVPFVTQASVEDEVRWMQEIYAQVGIAVVADIRPPVNVPNGVDLTNGIDVENSAEEAALLDMPRTPVSVNGKHDVEIYYVNRFTPQDRLAYAISDSDRANKQHVNVAILGKDRVWRTLAHEVGHVLDDIPPGTADPHYPYDWDPKDPTDQVNLMVQSSTCNTPWLVTDSHRLTQKQQDRWDLWSHALLW